MPKCTINGKEIEVKEGTSVIEAFAQMDEKIAHYCWHPGLSVAGVCRMCMVEVEGNPKLQIACNTKVGDGMVISTKSEKVEEAVKWTLDFHLINHPLDCPICDQAGECGLQQQYMKFGKYDPEMSENKVKKRKVVDLGPKIVLDSERCILCSRCVRFTSEVTKTNELGIFNRGDHSEIGTVGDQPLDNNYSVNTVDICPVGALTSKEFRFQQRVWFLKDHETVCQGCSTGCNIKVSHNQLKVFRVRPRHNEDVNGYWMCDEGRDIEFVNKENRLRSAKKYSEGTTSTLVPGAAVVEIRDHLKKRIERDGKESVAVVLTAQYTCEELQDFIRFFKNDLGVSNIYHWVNNKESFDDFDGLLLRGDRNPNTKGLIEILGQEGINATWDQLESQLQGNEIKSVFVAGPENQKHYPDIAEKVKLVSQAEDVFWLTMGEVKELNAAKNSAYQVPLKSFLEKEGTFINRQGIRQKIEAGPVLVSNTFDLSQVAEVLAGRPIVPRPLIERGEVGRVSNILETERGHL